MSEWKEYKLNEIYDFASGLSKSRSEFGHGYGFLSYKDIFHNYFVPDTLTELVNSTEKEQRSCSIQRGDVFLTRTSETDEELGMSCVALKDYPKATFNGFTKRLRPNKLIEVLPEYAGFFFRSPYFRATVSGISSITTRASLNNGMLSSLSIIVPPIDKQIKIAETLKSLHDKIDLLHRQNNTLEKMAETLFRQWFVEEAKEEWEEETIEDVAIHSKNGINPQKYSTTLFTHYSIPSFDNNKEPIKELGSTIQSGKYIVPKCCILFSKLNPHKVKRVWLLLDNVDDNAICSTEFQVIKPKEIDYLFLIYGWLTYKENYDEIASGIGGTSGSHQRIDPSTIFSFSCPKVDVQYVKSYNKNVQPLFEKIVNNQNQIRTLAKLRDTMLPKLMSGEVSVKQFGRY
ncbi:MAG TPA: hypothetical protein DDZ57_04750 [Porphyromonadaceae bacterium]|jgi:type I restriction enzyme S subunit|nr:hypothetical protein [Porphyromonadaceae bacterium]